MATFKVGQRVRVVRMEPDMNVIVSPVGKEGTIVGTGTFFAWHVKVPGTSHSGPLVGGSLPSGVWAFDSCHLAPANDDKADQFIEQVKKWKPLHVEPKVGYLSKERS